ncbi:hypothetical protein HOY80DRAFT_1054378 [Tuber brumale]|nr:hypothetical protein HOY80DRAFT_1054378 [Tuber brumale]
MSLPRQILRTKIFGLCPSVILEIGVRLTYSLARSLQGPLDASCNTLVPSPTCFQLSKGARNVYSTPISIKSPLDAAFNTLAPRPTQYQLSNGPTDIYSTPISMKLQIPSEVSGRSIQCFGT